VSLETTFVKSELRYFYVNRFFKESSVEEREHAEKLMEYQVFDTLHLHLNCC
jgi:ferritin